MRGIELSDSMMDAVNGGVTLYPDSEGSLHGTISSYGVDGRPYKYDNEALVLGYIAIHCRDKSWTGAKELDDYLIAGLLAEGLISKI